MLAGLEPFLPALDNPPVFFAAAALLLGLLPLSLGSILLRRPGVALGARVNTLKKAVAIPAWSLSTLWVHVAIENGHPEAVYRKNKWPRRHLDQRVIRWIARRQL